MYEVKEPLWQFVDYWQTLIAALVAGGLALLAGGLTVCGTLRAAKRQVKAVNDAADRQITAAQEQTAAAQHQTEVMRDIERRRIAREGYAFYAMLEAAMEAVIEDVNAARELAKRPRSVSASDRRVSPEAYEERQRVKRAGFAELRGAFLLFGGTFTKLFLQLDKEIEDFAAQCGPERQYFVSGSSRFVGLNEGLRDQLNRIEQLAMALRREAQLEQDRWLDVLHGGYDPDDVGERE